MGKCSKDIRQAINTHLKTITERDSDNIFMDKRSDQYAAASAGGGIKKMINAAAAYTRAQKQGMTPSGFIPTNDQRKYYAVALNYLALKRGIQPKDDGTYDKKHYEELSPDSVLKFTASLYLADKNPQNDDETKQAHKDIDDEILQAYDNNEAEAAPAKQITAATLPYMTPEEFANADEDKQSAYLQTLDPADLETYKQARNKNQKQEAGKINITHKDPDWAHKSDDDDFKIEQGDIIEYLMKDVILSSIAWTANRTTGFVGTLAYESCSSIWHHAKEAWRKDKYGDKEKEKKPQTPQDYRELFDLCNKDLNDYIADKQDKLNKIPDPNDDSHGQKLHEIEERLVRHDINLDNIRDENTRNYLYHLQEELDEQHLNRMLTRFPNKNDAEKEEIKQKFKKFTEDKDAAARDSSRPVPEPELPDYFGAELGAVFKATENETVKSIPLMHDIDRIYKQKEIFTKNYAAYVFTEAFRQHPEITADDAKVTKMLAEAEAEANVMFFKAQKDRKEQQDRIDAGETIPDDQRIPSNEELLNLVKKQRDTSFNKLDTEPESKEKVDDEVKAKLIPSDKPLTENETNSLKEEAEKEFTIDTILDHQIANCKQREGELIGDSAEIVARRNRVAATRDRLKNIKERSDYNELKDTKQGTVYTVNRERD